MNIQQHYQLLQNEYMKQKQEKYNNLGSNMFKAKPKKKTIISAYYLNWKYINSNLQLDGGNTIIGTEFIKLLATGSSNFATEAFVSAAVAQGGGGGGSADLTNYYDKTETNNLIKC